MVSCFFQSSLLGHRSEFMVCKLHPLRKEVHKTQKQPNRMQKRVEVHAEYKVTLRIFLYSAQPVCLVLIKQKCFL